MNHQEWYIRAFEKWYPIIYRHRDSNEAREQVEFACTELQLHKDSKVLDLCCGYGRHLEFLDKKVSFTVGLDLSIYLLNRAQDLNVHRISLVRGDVRYLPFFSYTFDAVLVFFTSFGYFKRHEENIQQLEQISYVLKNGGKFLFDYLNPLQVQKIKDIETEKKYKSYVIKENRCYNEKTKELKKYVRIYLNDSKQEDSYTEIVKVYSLDELIKMFSSNKLNIQRIYGSYQKDRYTDDSPRLIIIGSKHE